MPTRITFLGGVGTVTGSKYLLENDRSRAGDPLSLDPASSTAGCTVVTRRGLRTAFMLRFAVRR